LVAKKNENWIGFRWSLIVVLLLAVWTASLAVPRPKVVFHGGPRWIGENMLVGIPVLCAFVLFTGFTVHRWRTRDQRKLDRLRDERLRAEEKKTRTQQELEQKRQIDELKRQIAEVQRQADQSERDAKRQETEDRKQAAALRKQTAALRKRELREEIKGEERLREERLRSETVT
jgi:hypothetical protein